METSNVLLNQPIVIDNGSGTTKAGFAGEEQPKCFASSIVGRPKYSRIMAGALQGDNFIGSNAQNLRGLLKIRYPIEHGIVTDWEDMELIWQSIYNNDLKISAEDHGVLLTEAPLNPKSNREKMSEIFYESFNVPALYISIQAVLSLYASGQTTGLVLDSGDGVTHSVPVYEGFSIPNSIQRIDIAGRDITEQLQILLRKSGYYLETSAEKETVRIIKEKLCYISLQPQRDEKDWTSSISSTSVVNSENYKLPDGKIINLGSERFRAPEILFNPEIIGSESKGIHQMVYDSIRRSDMDLRSSLYTSIILSGGTTLSRNFADRILNELRRLSPRGTKIKIFAPPERKYSTWIGGSILAGLSTFKRMWVTSQDWKENPGLIHTKCL